MDFEVRGADQLAALSKRLRAAGESGKGLRKELFRAIQRSTKGVKADVAESFAQQMPHRGGLASRPLLPPVRVRVCSRNDVGVRIVSASRDGYNLSAMDQGTVRHPVFGNRKAWGITHVRPGIITEPQEQAAPDVREEIMRAISEINRKAEGT